MNAELDALLRLLETADESHQRMRLQFGLQCALRVEPLLEDDEVRACLNRFKRLMESGTGWVDVADLAAEAERLANRHPGSRSLDGVGHAAVSATYACAKAMGGRARQAAEYAAYAAVYGQGGYGATTDPDSFKPEQEWQLSCLRSLLSPVP